ncbi:DUF2510 domain-containing protein [Geodermatophilus sp. SYSU D00779]
MTGTSSAPPGWYPDPDGVPGMVRWWNGGGWSDVTTPVGPGVAVQAPATAPAPVPEPAAPPPPPGPGRTPRRTGWVVGLSVLGLVLVVLIGFLVGRPSSSVDDTGPTALPAPSGPAFPPGTLRIVDEAAGIAYPYLGQGWLEYDLQDVAETTSVAGQYTVTQESTPDGGPFIAQCTSGPLSPLFDPAGGLQPTLAQVADSVRLNYYPGPNEREVLRDEARTVDGAPAHLLEFDLSWDVEGYEATGERAALLLVDVGRPVPALLYLSIPNTHAELYGVIDRVIDGIDVL